DVHGAVDDAGEAALVGGAAGNEGVAAGVDGQAAGQQGHGLRRTAVVAQGGEQRVGDADDVAVDPVDQAARAARADQVVRPPDTAADVGPKRLAGADLVIQRRRRAPRGVDQATAEVGGVVAADGAVGQRGRAVAAVGVQAAAAAGAVVADGAVGQRGRGIALVQAAADGNGGVAVDGAAGQRGGATPDVQAASRIVAVALVVADRAVAQHGRCPA